MSLATAGGGKGPHTTPSPVVVAPTAAAVAAAVGAAVAGVAAASGPAGLSAVVGLSARVAPSALAVSGMAGTQAEEAWEPGQLALVSAPALLVATAPQPTGVETMPRVGWPDKVGLAGCSPDKVSAAVTWNAAAARAWPAKLKLVVSGGSEVPQAKGSPAFVGAVSGAELRLASVPHHLHESLISADSGDPSVGPCRQPCRLGPLCKLGLLGQ